MYPDDLSEGTMAEAEQRDTQSYYLPLDVIAWVKAQAEAEDRSASWIVAKHLRAAMAADDRATTTDADVERGGAEMSATPRCHECGHKRGPRSTAPVAKGTAGTPEARPKKAPCTHDCHTNAVQVARRRVPVEAGR